MILDAIDPEDALTAGYLKDLSDHIEMFQAVAGKADELIEERRMENAYLIATGLRPNMIFRRAAGSDVDSFYLRTLISSHHDTLAVKVD